jgi:hypothetical protein
MVMLTNHIFMANPLTLDNDFICRHYFGLRLYTCHNRYIYIIPYLTLNILRRYVRLCFRIQNGIMEGTFYVL